MAYLFFALGFLAGSLFDGDFDDELETIHLPNFPPPIVETIKWDY